MQDFEEIIKEYHPILFKIARAYSDSRDFDDLYQEMLISIWKGLKNFRGESKISTWLYRVVLNTALSYRKTNSRKLSFAGITLASGIAAAPRVDHSEGEREIEKLYVAIRQLKPDDRSIILLYLEEKSYEEIADIIGISISNVGVKINRIKKKLFKLLNA